MYINPGVIFLTQRCTAAIIRYNDGQCETIEMDAVWPVICNEIRWPHNGPLCGQDALTNAALPIPKSIQHIRSMQNGFIPKLL